MDDPLKITCTRDATAGRTSSWWLRQACRDACWQCPDPAVILQRADPAMHAASLSAAHLAGLLSSKRPPSRSKTGKSWDV